MNFVFIMTDTQNRSMVGAYGRSEVDTPNLDRLAAEGMRFDRAYTTCPLCTPARSGIFTGTHPPVNGAWCNNLPPYPTHPMWGDVFRHLGYRAGYTGKWHLDGSGYFGDGQPGGGFEPDWWYDGWRYAADIGEEMFGAYRGSRSPDDLRQAGFTESVMWGHRVADRAIDFLQQVDDDPFILAVSFDEPHGPYVAPPEYWEKFDTEDIPPTEHYGAPLEGKPRLQEIHRRAADPDSWDGPSEATTRFYGCNSYIDREIGRVIDAVDRLHGEDTCIIYTSDHGDMLGAHGLTGKGPMMYEQITNIPLIVRAPGIAGGQASDAPVSHLDILPTMLEFAGADTPGCLHGQSLRPLLDGSADRTRGAAFLSFTRFAINHDNWGEFYPIRCATDGRYKLSINLFETDELYDLESDGGEAVNRIDDPSLTDVRDHLHDAILDEMDRVRDPFRSFRWGDRAWRTVREEFYRGGERRAAPERFPFQPASLEADGTISGVGEIDDRTPFSDG